jgi:hypothetical protein
MLRIQLDSNTNLTTTEEEDVFPTTSPTSSLSSISRSASPTPSLKSETSVEMAE